MKTITRRIVTRSLVISSADLNDIDSTVRARAPAPGRDLPYMFEGFSFACTTFDIVCSIEFDSNDKS